LTTEFSPRNRDKLGQAGFFSLVSGTNFVKMSGVGSPNLKIINNITFLQTPRFRDRQVRFSEPYYNQKRFREPNLPVENGNLSCFLRFGEPTPLRPKIVPLTNGFFYGKAIKIRFFAEQKSCKSCLSCQKRHFAKQNIKKYACHFFIGKPFEFELVPEFEF
jgi:hypothetical protein